LKFSATIAAMIKRKIIGGILIVFCQLIQAAPVNTSIKACFTPTENCTAEIVAEIAQAKKSLYVQAYSFTSAPIAQALAAANKRGVDVKVLLDKSQTKAKYSSANYLDNQGIWTRIDYQPAIAHNKIMIIDNETVITGSFNFTKAAQYKNTENVLIIQDSELAKEYTQNWLKRAGASVTKEDYLNSDKPTTKTITR
jgi:phosphatidylserine/phosphatidylglycerophosphate/cardiolipin synthase-like enzyme